MELSAAAIAALTAQLDDRLVARLSDQEDRMMGFIGKAIDQRLEEKLKDMEKRLEEKLLGRIEERLDRDIEVTSQTTAATGSTAESAPRKRRATSPASGRTGKSDSNGINDKRIWLVGFQREMTAPALNKAMKWAMDQIGFTGVLEFTSRGSSKSASALCKSPAEVNHVIELFRRLDAPLSIGELKVRVVKDRSLQDRVRGRIFNQMWQVSAAYMSKKGLKKFQLGTTGARGTLFVELPESDVTSTLWRIVDDDIQEQPGWNDIGATSAEVQQMKDEIVQALAQPTRG